MDELNDNDDDEFESEAPVTEEMQAAASVFSCALKVVTVAELFLI